MTGKITLQAFLAQDASPGPRQSLPLLAAPGMQLLGLPADKVHRSGQLQFECIRALSEYTNVPVLVTFMDLSVEAEAFGCAIQDSATGNPEIIGALPLAGLTAPSIGAGRTGEQLHCAELCASQLSRPVLGGLIGPFTLCCRLLGMADMMMLAATEPEPAREALQIASDFLRRYLTAMREAGLAGAVIAEPAAGLLSPDMCRDFSAAYLQSIVQPVQSDSFGVILHNCGQAAKQISAMLSSGALAIHVGNAVDLVSALEQVPGDYPVLGNIDPAGVFCHGTPATVRASVLSLLQATAAFPNHILSSGCDIPAQAPLANIKAFFAAVDEFNAGQS